MNLQNKILFMLFALGTIFGGCDSLIYDDLSDCPQGVYVKFYSMTPCQVDSLYPSDIRNLNVYAFDKNDILISSQEVKDATLGKNYRLLVPVPSHGLYTFVAWGGINDHYTLQSFQTGKTTKKEVLLSLKHAQTVAENLTGTKLYQGISPAVMMPDPKDVGSWYEYTAVNMQEVTNRIEVIVEGLPETDVKNYSIGLTLRNSDYTFDGQIAMKGDSINYPAQTTVTGEVISAKFTTLKLATGYHDWIIIKDTKNNKVLYHGDLLGTLLLKNPNVNLACDHDFVIRFRAKDKCECGTYVITEIFVNNWLVHSYETEL